MPTSRVKLTLNHRLFSGRLRHYGLLLGFALVSLHIGSLQGQEKPDLSELVAPQATAQISPTSAEEIAIRRFQLAEERAKFEAKIREKAPESAIQLSDIARQLDNIDVLLEQQAELAAPLIEAKTQEAADDTSVFSLNALLEEQIANEQLLRDQKENLANLRKRLDKARRQREQDSGDSSVTATAADDLFWQDFDPAELAARARQEEVYLATLEVSRTESVTGGKGPLGNRIAVLREKLARGEGSPEDGLLDLAKKIGSLQQSLERTQRLQETAELRLEAAQRRYSQNPDSNAELLQHVEALATTRDAIRQQTALGKTTLERLEGQREIWQDWAASFKPEQDKQALENWRALAKNRLDELKQEQVQRQGRVANLQTRLEKIEAQLGGLSAESTLRPVLREQEETVRRLYVSQLDEVRAIAADLRLTERFLDEVNRRRGSTALLEYLSLGTEGIQKIWNYRITTVDDAPFTIGSLTLGIFFFVIGLWASKLGSRIVGRLSEERLKLDAGSVQTLQTLSFYALLTGFTLLALQAVHFPLTAFTFLGGALAIGVGFGSQNVMNNFISGLILMLERPVRARDVVEVDGNHGTIQKIGARSTQIHSTDGRHIIVPNSFFLESNVVNWTLSDDLIRTRVSVGVMYGSPTRLVEELIYEVVHTDSNILQQPPPNVVFEAFADNSLNFDVYFWVRARSPMGVRNIESRVRFRIDELFREHHLVIAFPQRDVHLDTPKPLEVRMVGAEDGSAPDST